MKSIINAIKRALGISNMKNGLDLVNETLAGFVTIVEDLSYGATLISDDIEDNEALIAELTLENQELLATRVKAQKVIDNIKTLVGE